VATYNNAAVGNRWLAEVIPSENLVKVSGEQVRERDLGIEKSATQPAGQFSPNARGAEIEHR
jgi:hypothetical protein